MTVIFQIKQFFVPFPKAGSWAYRFYMWLYDRKIKNIEKDHISITVGLEFPRELNATTFSDAIGAAGRLIDNLEGMGISVKQLDLRLKENDNEDKHGKLPDYTGIDFDADGNPFAVDDCECELCTGRTKRQPVGIFSKNDVQRGDSEDSE